MKGYPTSGHPAARAYVRTLSTVAWLAMLAVLVLTSHNNIVRYEHAHPNHPRLVAPAASGGVHGRVRYAINHPCLSEDSSNCYYDAHARGNRKGHSFYAITVPRPRGPQEVCIFYWSHPYGRQHNHCRH